MKKLILLAAVFTLTFVSCKKDEAPQVCPLTGVKDLVKTTDAAGWYQYTGTYNGTGEVQRFYIDIDHELTDCELMYHIKN